MSRENVEVIEGAYEAVRSGRMREWAQRQLPPDIEWHPFPEAPDYQPRRGPQGVADYFEETLENTPVWQPQISAVTEVGPGSYVVDAEATAESRQGVGGEVTFSQLWEFADEQPVRVREFLDRSQALQAARLSE